MNTGERELFQAFLKAVEWYVLTLASSSIRKGNVSPIHMDRPREALLDAIDAVIRKS